MYLIPLFLAYLVLDTVDEEVGEDNHILLL
jgi:hypothetical protein